MRGRCLCLRGENERRACADDKGHLEVRDSANDKLANTAAMLELSFEWERTVLIEIQWHRATCLVQMTSSCSSSSAGAYYERYESGAHPQPFETKHFFS